MSGQNDPKRAKSWTIRFNCPIQMGFIHRSFSSGRGLRQTITALYSVIESPRLVIILSFSKSSGGLRHRLCTAPKSCV